jgi:hypothetical protein
MSFKIKPSRKVQRRGNRLIVQRGDERAVLVGEPGEQRRVVEFTKPGQHFTVTYSPCGSYSLAKGTVDGESLQFVAEGDFFDERVAARRTDDDPWIFRTPEGEYLVSITDTAIRNLAVAVSAVVAEMDPALALFLKVHPALCRVTDIDEIHTNPRWKALRDFKFELTRPTGPIGTGRRAENTVRHQLSNYDEMLREGAKSVGGILYPEQYDRIRKGVDRIIASAMEARA